jgi:peptidoglycan/xylan/chitin deacetylase (PgdA/CDA1 family)
MSIANKLVAASYYPIKFANCAAELTCIRSPNTLRVLIYHDIPPEQTSNFAKQLRWLKKSWNFISPQEFTEIIEGGRPASERDLLLTFDDGFASNKTIASSLLKELDIKALFFIISGFASITSHEEAKHFIANNILPGSNPQQIPPHMYNMSWSDIAELAEEGHEIGAHTATHTRLSSIKQREQLIEEIASSADTIEKRTGVKVDHFAFTFGDLGSFSPEAMAIASQRFKFIYSGLRGNNSPHTSRFALRRDSLQTYDSLWQIGSFLEGTADIVYTKSLKKLDHWAIEHSKLRL